MMDWYGNDVNAWGYVLMAVGMLAFWAVVVVGIAVVFGRLGRPAPQRSMVPRRPEELLAERFASGDIDGPEYRDRLAVLPQRGR